MIQLPPSKSIGARFLVASFFAGTLPADPIFDDNDDLIMLQQALLVIFSDEEPIDYGDSPIDVGASGTALRFVTAVCASTPEADYVITGTNRLMQRPMEPLLNLLKEAGAGIECLGDKNTGPYRIKGNTLKGGDFSIRGDISSQFISALMLAAPYWEKGMNLKFTTPLVSSPYIEMTARVMQKFGIEATLSADNVSVKPGKYKKVEDFNIEADWSSASFFYEACALGAKNIVIQDLTPPSRSLQGDATAAEIFKKLGIVSEFNACGAALTLSEEPASKLDLDFKDCPDLVLPVAVACLCKNVPFHFSNIAHLRLKESDRVVSLQNEALKLGCKISAGDDFIEWDGQKAEAPKDPLIETYDDHRVAMAFAMAAFKTGEIRIQNPRVVEKSFIDFWNRVQEIGLVCSQINDIMTVSLPINPVS